jgi:Lon protease-like protein
MTSFIPVFPLDIVVFPGESLNLHIFEARYIQMIKEKIADKKPFGIPSVINKVYNELGTTMEIVEVVKEYENGEMDVRTRGVQVFRMLQPVSDIPDKLYSGAIVNFPENNFKNDDTNISKVILEEVKRMYTLFNVEAKFPVHKQEAVSYEIGHFVGFTREQEYDLLGLFTEVQRLEYIRRHLNNILPVVKELEAMKARIQMNGHFRDLSL